MIFCSRSAVCFNAVSIGTRTRSEFFSLRTKAAASRSEELSVSATVFPLVQSRPKFAGCSGSPSTLTTRLFSTCKIIPQPTPQYGHTVLTLRAVTGGMGKSFAICEQNLQRVQIVARGELLKCLVVIAFFEIHAQHFLQRQRQFRRAHAGKNLPANRLVFAKAAADENMVAVLAAHLRAEAADVAHVMLRAGIQIGRAHV